MRRLRDLAGSILWRLDEDVNHRLPEWAFQRWLCNLNDRVLLDDLRPVPPSPEMMRMIAEGKVGKAKIDPSRLFTVVGRGYAHDQWLMGRAWSPHRHLLRWWR